MAAHLLPPISPDADPFLRDDFPEPRTPPPLDVPDAPVGTPSVSALPVPQPVEPVQVAEDVQWRGAWAWTRRWR